MSSTDQKTEQDAPAERGPADEAAATAQSDAGAVAEPAPAEDDRGAAGRPSSRVAWFAVLLALVAGGLAGGVWYDLRKRADAGRDALAERLHAIENQQRQLRTLAQEAQQTAQSVQGKLSTLEVRVADTLAQRQAVEALYQELTRNRTEWRIAEVEQMIDIAAQQLDLAGNLRGALLALQLAESRLSRSDEAAFGPLRTALARDIEKLKALPAFDPGTLGQRIERLAVSVETLPLAFDERPAGAAARAAPGEAGARWYERLGAEVWGELKQLVVVRRVDAPEPPLLAPSQAYFLRENLRLRLLSARLALLTRDATAYRENLQVAQGWMQRYFDTRSKRTGEALAQLAQLAETQIRFELPSIEGSINAVRALSTRGGRGS